MEKTSSTNFYAQMRKVAKAENTARQTRMPMTTQWDQMSAQQKNKVPSTNLYSMFRAIEAGEKNDWASLGKNNLPGDEEQTQAVDDPNMHFLWS